MMYLNCPRCGLTLLPATLSLPQDPCPRCPEHLAGFGLFLSAHADPRSRLAQATPATPAGASTGTPAQGWEARQ